MIKILYLLFFYLFIVDYAIVFSGVIPRAFTWMPEVLSGLVVLVVCVHIAKNRIIFIPTRYVIIFSFLFAFLALGIVVNQVQPGAVFAGVRKYFRYAPFFSVTSCVSV